MTSSIAFQLKNGLHMSVEAIAEQTFRIRASRRSVFSETPLFRYGIMKPGSASAPAALQRESSEAIDLRSGQTLLTIDKRDGTMALARTDGTVLASGELLSEREPVGNGARARLEAQFRLEDDDRLYGLGDLAKDRIQVRGIRAEMRMSLNFARVPIPFVMSSRGWALLVHTTRPHVIDVGCTVHHLLRFDGGGDELHFYLFGGRDCGELLKRYTGLAGKPELLPMWAYGLTYISNQYASARDIIEDGLNFRRDGIPCDTIGLEPGWMETYRDHSTAKRWHPERFAIPYWNPKGPRTFFGALERMGFKLSMWLCCIFDITREEERQLAAAQAARGERPEDAEPPTAADDSADRSSARAETGEPVEAWYDHLRKFVDQGVSAFKLESYVFDHIAGLQWANGLSSEEMHHLYQLLLCKQMYAGFAEQTGRRPLLFSMSGFAGIQRYAATWSEDRPESRIALLNQNMSGHVNGLADMDVQSAVGIHVGFLQTLAQVNSWAYWQHPSLLEPRLQQMFRQYARLRYKWLPYLYSAAYTAACTGMPVMRPMPLVCPDNPDADKQTTQYMLGDALLVGWTEQLHLPAGEWLDYWTGQRFTGPRQLTCEVPPHAGGPLFIRGNAILTEWPDWLEINHIRQPLPDTIRVRIYPYGDSGETTLYEDDGTTNGYRQGACTKAVFRFRVEGDRLSVELSPRSGSFAGMPAERFYEVIVHSDSAPEELRVDGVPQPRGAAAPAGEPQGWQFDPDAREIRVRVAEDSGRRLPVRIDIRRGFAVGSAPWPEASEHRPAADAHPPTANEWILQVLELLDEGDGRNESLHAVAERLHVNSSHLSRLFKREMGVSFSAYALKRKMERARRMLQENRKIEEIAESLGFTDSSHFIRSFRGYWGTTPGKLKASVKPRHAEQEAYPQEAETDRPPRK